jgi:terminal uridylyltransferase
MLPSPEGTLEDRLRGLILNNAISNPPPSNTMQPPARPSLPPHMLMASPEDQQQYLARAAEGPQPEPDRSMLHGQQAQGQQPQTGRKRLNQAQRRQMNSQLSIPIDARPQQNLQPVRGYGNAQQPWSFHNNDSPRPQYTKRFPQQSPQFQQPASTYSPHGMYQRGPQPSPRGQYPHGNQQSHPRQGQQYTNQQHQPGNFNYSGYSRPQPQNRKLYQPGAPTDQGRGRPLMRHDPEDLANQSAHLERLLLESVPNVGIDPKEEAEKETFRIVVEQACREAITEHEQQELGNAKFDVLSVELKCFGSMSSGFATRSSDVDLALITPHSKPPADSPESCIPRILEKKLLDAGYGARLLTRTRVPIIKLCEKPTEKLRTDLMEERTKWEHGFTEDQNGRAETPEAEVPADGHEAIAEKPWASPIPSPAEPLPQKQADSNKIYLAEVKQKGNQSIVDYYNVAKRVLRKMGGFDLSASSHSPDAYQAKILNDVCSAFISGLSSEALSIRLRSYRSISPLFDESGEFIQRSLNGVWTQIEGERLAMAYDSRPLTEANERRESECLALVEAWRRLQDQFGAQTDSLLYNRQLYTAYEKLRSMSSLALVLLEQIQHEQPSYYAVRAHRLMDDLRQREQTTSDTVTPIIIAHYVSGIRNSQIQEDIQKLSLSEQSFTDVVLQHRILQLSVDFEHALKKDLYADEDRSYIEQYVTFLRSRATGSESPDVDSDLLAKIRTLPDPTQISLNKPRDRYRDHLEFPKTDIGIQCDINFSAHLALHNTLLLRCYSHSDPRVRLLILFIKHWTKIRAINTPYRGTLSSYGYVLMVLHYLVNIAFPFVCPNLQVLRKDSPSSLPPAEMEARTTCKGRDVRFWRNEAEIKDLANRGLLNQNKDSVGFLLRGFFEYFAQSAQMSTVQCRGFDWGREVLSLRTLGGILTKQEKGWTGAKTVFETTTIAAPPTPSTPSMKVDSPKDLAGAVVDDEVEVKTPKLPVKTVEETKEIRHRYLFAIEDPFELDHNVARTVGKIFFLSARRTNFLLQGYS